MFYSHAIASVTCLEMEGEPVSLRIIVAAERRHRNVKGAITGVNNG